MRVKQHEEVDAVAVSQAGDSWDVFQIAKEVAMSGLEPMVPGCPRLLPRLVGSWLAEESLLNVEY